MVVSASSAAELQPGGRASAMMLHPRKVSVNQTAAAQSGGNSLAPAATSALHVVHERLKEKHEQLLDAHEKTLDSHEALSNKVRSLERDYADLHEEHQKSLHAADRLAQLDGENAKLSTKLSQVQKSHASAKSRLSTAERNSAALSKKVQSLTAAHAKEKRKSEHLEKELEYSDAVKTLNMEPLDFGPKKGGAAGALPRAEGEAAAPAESGLQEPIIESSNNGASPGASSTRKRGSILKRPSIASKTKSAASTSTTTNKDGHTQSHTPAKELITQTSTQPSGIAPGNRSSSTDKKVSFPPSAPTKASELAGEVDTILKTLPVYQQRLVDEYINRMRVDFRDQFVQMYKTKAAKVDKLESDFSSLSTKHDSFVDSHQSTIKKSQKYYESKMQNGLAQQETAMRTEFEKHFRELEKQGKEGTEVRDAEIVLLKQRVKQLELEVNDAAEAFEEQVNARAEMEAKMRDVFADLEKRQGELLDETEFFEDKAEKMKRKAKGRGKNAVGDEEDAEADESMEELRLDVGGGGGDPDEVLDAISPLSIKQRLQAFAQLEKQNNELRNMLRDMERGYLQTIDELQHNGEFLSAKIQELQAEKKAFRKTEEALAEKTEREKYLETELNHLEQIHEALVQEDANLKLKQLEQERMRQEMKGLASNLDSVKQEVEQLAEEKGKLEQERAHMVGSNAGLEEDAARLRAALADRDAELRKIKEALAEEIKSYNEVAEDLATERRNRTAAEDTKPTSPSSSKGSNKTTTANKIKSSSSSSQDSIASDVQSDLQSLISQRKLEKEKAARKEAKLAKLREEIDYHLDENEKMKSEIDTHVQEKKFIQQRLDQTTVGMVPPEWRNSVVRQSVLQDKVAATGGYAEFRSRQERMLQKAKAVLDSTAQPGAGADVGQGGVKKAASTSFVPHEFKPHGPGAKSKAQTSDHHHRVLGSAFDGMPKSLPHVSTEGEAAGPEETEGGDDDDDDADGGPASSQATAVPKINVVKAPNLIPDGLGSPVASLKKAPNLLPVPPPAAGHVEEAATVPKSVADRMAMFGGGSSMAKSAKSSIGSVTHVNSATPAAGARHFSRANVRTEGEAAGLAEVEGGDDDGGEVLEEEAAPASPSVAARLAMFGGGRSSSSATATVARSPGGSLKATSPVQQQQQQQQQRPGASATFGQSASPSERHGGETSGKGHSAKPGSAKISFSTAPTKPGKGSVRETDEASPSGGALASRMAMFGGERESPGARLVKSPVVVKHSSAAKAPVFAHRANLGAREGEAAGSAEQVEGGEDEGDETAAAKDVEDRSSVSSSGGVVAARLKMFGGGSRASSPETPKAPAGLTHGIYHDTSAAALLTATKQAKADHNVPKPQRILGTRATVQGSGPDASRFPRDKASAAPPGIVAKQKEPARKSAASMRPEPPPRPLSQDPARRAAMATRMPPPPRPADGAAESQPKRKSVVEHLKPSHSRISEMLSQGSWSSSPSASQASSPAHNASKKENPARLAPDQVQAQDGLQAPKAKLPSSPPASRRFLTSTPTGSSSNSPDSTRRSRAAGRAAFFLQENGPARFLLMQTFLQWKIRHKTRKLTPARGVVATSSSGEEGAGRGEHGGPTALSAKSKAKVVSAGGAATEKTVQEHETEPAFVKRQVEQLEPQNVAPQSATTTTTAATGQSTQAIPELRRIKLKSPSQRPPEVPHERRVTAFGTKAHPGGKQKAKAAAETEIKAKATTSTVPVLNDGTAAAHIGLHVSASDSASRAMHGATRPLRRDMQEPALSSVPLFHSAEGGEQEGSAEEDVDDAGVSEDSAEDASGPTPSTIQLASVRSQGIAGSTAAAPKTQSPYFSAALGPLALARQRPSADEAAGNVEKAGSFSKASSSTSDHEDGAVLDLKAKRLASSLLNSDATTNTVTISLGERHNMSPQVSIPPGEVIVSASRQRHDHEAAAASASSSSSSSEQVEVDLLDLDSEGNSEGRPNAEMRHEEQQNTVALDARSLRANAKANWTEMRAAAERKNQLASQDEPLLAAAQNITASSRPDFTVELGDVHLNVTKGVGVQKRSLIGRKAQPSKVAKSSDNISATGSAQQGVRHQLAPAATAAAAKIATSPSYTDGVDSDASDSLNRAVSLGDKIPLAPKARGDPGTPPQLASSSPNKAAPDFHLHDAGIARSGTASSSESDEHSSPKKTSSVAQQLGHHVRHGRHVSHVHNLHSHMHQREQEKQKTEEQKEQWRKEHRRKYRAKYVQDSVTGEVHETLLSTSDEGAGDSADDVTIDKETMKKYVTEAPTRSLHAATLHAVREQVAAHLDRHEELHGSPGQRQEAADAASRKSVQKPAETGSVTPPAETPPSKERKSVSFGVDMVTEENIFEVAQKRVSQEIARKEKKRKRKERRSALDSSPMRDSSKEKRESVIPESSSASLWSSSAAAAPDINYMTSADAGEKTTTRRSTKPEPEEGKKTKEKKEKKREKKEKKDLKADPRNTAAPTSEAMSPQELLVVSAMKGAAGVAAAGGASPARVSFGTEEQHEIPGRNSRPGLFDFAPAVRSKSQQSSSSTPTIFYSEEDIKRLVQKEDTSVIDAPDSPLFKTVSVADSLADRKRSWPATKAPLKFLKPGDILMRSNVVTSSAPGPASGDAPQAQKPEDEENHLWMKQAVGPQEAAQEAPPPMVTAKDGAVATATAAQKSSAAKKSKSASKETRGASGAKGALENGKTGSRSGKGRTRGSASANDASSPAIHALDGKKSAVVERGKSRSGNGNVEGTRQRKGSASASDAVPRNNRRPQLESPLSAASIHKSWVEFTRMLSPF